MQYPICSVRTSTDRNLQGLFLENGTRETLFLHIHGTASNFYIENFYPALAQSLQEAGISYLATNNSGANALQGWVEGGSTTERFADCLTDIDAWISFAKARGYSKIFLSGHSLGTEKVVYYLAKGNQKEAVTAAILLAPADSYGTEMAFLGEKKEAVFQEARQMVAEGKGNEFLRSIWLSHAGYLPKSAHSFLDHFSEGSELSHALPFHQGELPLYRSISQPVLAAISDNEEDEYTILPIPQALELMRKENPRTETVIFSGSNHDFSGKEKEMSSEVRKFLLGL